MEPAVDPAQEIQAAGRIHRLGQEQDCFIKRLAFRDSIEEAVIELHAKIKSGVVKVVDGRVDSQASQAVLQAFQKGKVTHDHSRCLRNSSLSNVPPSPNAPPSSNVPPSSNRHPLRTLVGLILNRPIISPFSDMPSFFLLSMITTCLASSSLF
mmetsp:Transcript_978/g.2108  ORF Transcript_978/g.2108 Transcript_978/m.2108 type:complete len:153 (+) Transcript_978:1877-2335(+)